MSGLIIEEVPLHKNKKTPVSDRQLSTVSADSIGKRRMKRLHFTSGGTKKYKFTLDAEMRLNVMHTKTKTETSWILQVQDIEEDRYVIDLLAYDIVLKECNNEGFKELFHITRQFQKLYDEIRVKTDLEGNVVRVLNQKQLIDKWAQIKSETIQYFSDDMNLDDFFAIDDEEFSKPSFLHKIVSEVEFFFMYLQMGGYGRKLNSLTVSELKRDNAFRTNTITWDLEFYGSYDKTSNSEFGTMSVTSVFKPGSKWLRKAYGEIPFINIENLEPNFNLEGKSSFYKDSGWLKEAELCVNEIVHSNLLYHKMKYKIQEIL